MFEVKDTVQTSLQRLKAPTFKPLGPDEEIVPGTLLGIDTEFVAHSPPDKVMRGCVPQPLFFPIMMMQRAACRSGPSHPHIGANARMGES